MDVEEKNPTSLKLVNQPNLKGVDFKNSSMMSLQLKDSGSYGDEISPKVRKPYTMTKQRERWTEEEHKKFLEALQLYGRAWRRIEEHIGTKTAVQIRSHAQKFFSKVVRESSSNNCTGSVMHIEIPPPRPKRKPVHPYPRKLGNTSSKQVPTLKQLESPSLQISSICEQENRSPTSVLSAVGSEILGTACGSPVVSATGSTEQNNGGQSPISSVEQVKWCSSGLANAGVSTELLPVMVSDQDTDEHATVENESSVESQAPAIKLFGKTVVVSGLQRPTLLTVENTSECIKATTGVDIGNHQRITNMDLDAPAELPVHNINHGVFPAAVANSAMNPWANAMLPFVYCLQLPGDSMTVPTVTPLPWLAFYGSLPYPFIRPQTMHSEQQQQSCIEVVHDRETQREGSWTGSNTASVAGVVILDQNSDVAESHEVENPTTMESASALRLDQSDNTGSADKPIRGFVPYRRCAVETEMHPTQMIVEDREIEKLTLSL
ncbi:uncharacterized protein [Typha latifolia]|uniref:uncharacterized protein n=1 Tax=Typha latifolia TaxID=4733 RepID=UPI003C2F7E47